MATRASRLSTISASPSPMPARWSPTTSGRTATKPSITFPTPDHHPGVGRRRPAQRRGAQATPMTCWSPGRSWSSTTSCSPPPCGTIVDFDARDKIGASQADRRHPLGLVGWLADHVRRRRRSLPHLPTGAPSTGFRWAKTSDLNEMFQYTGVSVMAAVDGTVVSIDKNADGTAEQTCNLNQGQYLPVGR